MVVTARYADGTVSELFVPQSAAAIEDSLQVGVDEATGAVYVLWQKKTEWKPASVSRAISTAPGSDRGPLPETTELPPPIP